MEGTTYQSTSPFNLHVRHTFGLIRVTILVPGKANGVAVKLNSPNIYVYIYNEVLALADFRRFSLCCNFRSAYPILSGEVKI